MALPSASAGPFAIAALNIAVGKERQQQQHMYNQPVNKSNDQGASVV